jgi:hypothetical protein
VRIAVINYAHDIDPAYTKHRCAQVIQTRQAYKNYADRVISYGHEDIINTPFYYAHKLWLDSARGAGYWCWKPYLIQKAMLETHLVYDAYIYLDSDVQIKSSLTPFAELTLTQEVAGIRTTYQHSRFCKRDASIAFHAEDDPDYEKWYSMYAGVVAYANKPRALMFLTDWLTACTNWDLINDQPGTAPNYPYYLAHRNDQSLFTLIYHQYGFPIHPPATLAFTDLYPLPGWCQPSEKEGDYST